VSEIKPALTADDWESAQRGAIILPVGQRLPVAEVDTPDEWYGKPHEIAALCLYGQTFGFTREDLRQLRDAIDDLGYYTDEGPIDEGWQSPELLARIAHLESLANRIEALLPPE
jgi:hypothetical protein